MVLIKSAFVKASDFLLVLNEDSTLIDHKHVGCNVPISQGIIDSMTELFEHPSLIDTFSNFKSLPDLFQASSFLQMPVLTGLLVKLLNKLCQYDDPALVPLQGLINVYWLGDHSSLKSATKVWLGILSLPLKTKDRDSSCYSSCKLLNGATPCADLEENIIKFTDNDHACKDLIEKYCSPPFLYICTNAARYGRLELLQWARAKDFPWNNQTCSAAAENGHLEVFKWAVTNGCRWLEWFCSAKAAYGGHVEVLKWALQERFLMYDIYICNMAALGGHLNVLQLLRSQKPPCSWDETTCARASESGHLEVLQWARANGCPWDSQTCKIAAAYGHLEVLKWAIANGCPWNKKICVEVAKVNHEQRLGWTCSEKNKCQAAALSGNLCGHLEVLQWLIEN